MPQVTRWTLVMSLLVKGGRPNLERSGIRANPNGYNYQPTPYTAKI